MTKHKVQLPHGYLLESTTTLIDLESRTVHVSVDVYQDGQWLEQTARYLEGVGTNGELAVRRSKFYREIENTLPDLILA